MATRLDGRVAGVGRRSSMDYRIDIRKDTNGTYLASFPDLPGVHTYGATKREALERANDAFLTGVEFMIRTRREVPTPQAAGGTRFHVSAMVASKIELHNVMVRQDVNRAELSRRLLPPASGRSLGESKARHAARPTRGGLCRPQPAP